MLVLEWPPLVLALIPVIVIEFLVVRASLKKLDARKAGLGLTVANLASTVVGIPMTWAALVGCEYVVGAGYEALFKPYSETMFKGAHPPGPLSKLVFVAMQAPWLAPYESQLYWMIPLAAILLLVPFLAISYWMESWICRWWWVPLNAKAVGKAVWRANVASYGFLFILALAYMIYCCSCSN